MRQYDWYLETGFGEHSLMGDPEFVDLDGANDLLGSRRLEIGPPMIIDDSSSVTPGDPSFLASGSWFFSNPGYGGDQLETQLCDRRSEETCDTTSTATWQFTGLKPGSNYQIAATVTSDMYIEEATGHRFEHALALYDISDNRDVSRHRYVEQTHPSGAFYMDGLEWFELATVEMTGDILTVVLSNPTGGDKIFADAIRVVEVSGDTGADDDLHLRPTSPAIDAGEIAEKFVREPMPNGERMNIGGYGNTPEATPSASEGVQILSPLNGIKVGLGETVELETRSWGLLEKQTLVGLNLGNKGAVEDFEANAYQTEHFKSGYFYSAVDITLAEYAGPVDMYKSYEIADQGVGNKIGWSLPAQQGMYSLTLHFADPHDLLPGERVFDIFVNRALEVDDFDIIETVGAYLTATTLVIPVTVSDDSGIHLELVNQVGEALISGLELKRIIPGASPDASVDVFVSIDAGANWTLVTSDLALDEYGRTAASWVAASETLDARFRVVANAGSLPEAESAHPFQVANLGTEYYVNDDSTRGDEYTTTIRDNRNTGKSPDAPMASLAALISIYDLDPGDTVYVDTGDYRVAQNIVIGAEDAGVTVTGPTLEGHEASLDRASLLRGSYVFEIDSAEHVCLRHLSMGGAWNAIYVDPGSGSDDLILSNLDVGGNADHGIIVGAGNDNLLLAESTLHSHYGQGRGLAAPAFHGALIWGANAVIRDNTFYGNSDAGVVSSSPNGLVANNVAFENKHGIHITAGIAEDNRTWSNGIGIKASGAKTVARHNVTYANRVAGIYVTLDALALENTVSLNAGIDGHGIAVHNANAIGNEVYENRIGIYTSGSSDVVGGRPSTRGLISGNHVHDNSGTGIMVTGDTLVVENDIYSNRIGIELDHEFKMEPGFHGEISNNRIWQNSLGGIHAAKATWTEDDWGMIRNNTIIQTAGDAIHLETRLINLGTPNIPIWAPSVVEGVFIENNILDVEDGSAIFVGPHAQRHFASDYNLIHSMGDSVFGTWSGIRFTNLTDWFLELGHDRSSREADPLFANPLGVDGIAGCDRTPLGPAQIVDDGDPKFAMVNLLYLEANSTGYAGDSVAFLGAEAIWAFAGLTPGRTYQIAIPEGSGSGSPTHLELYGVSHDGGGVYERFFNRYVNDNHSFDAEETTWFEVGFATAETDTLTIRLASSVPGQNRLWHGVDAMRVVEVPGPGAADNDYHIGIGSPAIDGGDPDSTYIFESWPNASRINLGAYGNTPEAMHSAPLGVERHLADGIHVLTPTRHARFELGEVVDIDILTWSMLDREILLRLDAGGPRGFGTWEPNAYTVEAPTGGAHVNPIDLSVADAPGPEELYQTYAQAKVGLGNAISWNLLVADGEYEMVLHFAEPLSYPAGRRIFDVFINGTNAAADFDIVAAAGANLTATTLTIQGSATTGEGLLLELVNKKSYALISGVDLYHIDPEGVAYPTVDVDVTTDGGLNWTTIATGVGVDEYGRARVPWLADAETAQGQIRVSGRSGTLPVGYSDAYFTVAEATHVFYVNDGSLSNDEYTTAVGDNLNLGTRPDAPMASLSALLQAYDVGPGDIVYVDTGNYTLLNNIVLDAGDSGVTIQGPVQADHTATIDRNNDGEERYTFELRDDADDITISHLQITGASVGIYADASADSDGITISNSEIYGHANHGISFDESNDDITILYSSIHHNGTFTYDWAGNLIPSVSHGAHLLGEGIEFRGNSVYNNAWHGIVVASDHAVVSENEVHHNTYRGIELHGEAIEAQSNEVYSNEDGIYADGAGNRLTNNVIYSNSSTGITLLHGGIARGNLVHEHIGADKVGILIVDSDAAENELYRNDIGILTGACHLAGDVARNRVYGSRTGGIEVNGNTLVSGNRVYSNPVGITLSNGQDDDGVAFSGRVENNLIYANYDWGIVVESSEVAGRRAPLITNNTVYQEVGEAIRLNGPDTAGVVLRNNAIAVNEGYAIYVESAAQAGFSSEFNWLVLGNPAIANAGYWGGVEANSLADWHTVSGQDDPASSIASSLLDEPAFVDPDGADNVWGYDATTTHGFHGGYDDNFQLIGNALGIDHGDPFWAPLRDIEGSSRRDDVGSESGSGADYEEGDLGSSFFAEVGIAQEWQGVDDVWRLDLPFDFDFYGTTYSEVFVTSDGLLQFGSDESLSQQNWTKSEFIGLPRIAALWGEMNTDGANDDVFVDQSVAGQISIRWNATIDGAAYQDPPLPPAPGEPGPSQPLPDPNDLNFSVTLTDDAAGDRVEFHYGEINAPVFPIAGISKGDGIHFDMADTNGQVTPSDANSLEFHFVPGIADMGAYEFLGTSLDTTPPTLTDLLPRAVIDGEIIDTHQSALRLEFNEPLNVIDGNATVNYVLVEAGANGTLGDSDDVTISVTPRYTAGETYVLLEIPGGVLAEGSYRLSISPGDALRDRSGLALDGDLDGVEGGTWQRDFLVEDFAPSVTGVYVNSTSWSNTFSNHLQRAGLGDAGYRIPTGGASQLDDLPWVNIDQITIEFGEDVTETRADLQILGIAISSHAVVGFQYNAETHRATWTLETPLGPEDVQLVLSDAVVDSTGQALDGEWVDAGSQRLDEGRGSGDTVAGGDFEFRVHVLPGNAATEGDFVDSSDQARVRDALRSSVDSTFKYSVFLDVNGTGGINVQDPVHVRNRQGATLPTPPPPSATGSGASASTAGAVMALNPTAVPLQVAAATSTPEADRETEGATVPPQHAASLAAGDTSAATPKVVNAEPFGLEAGGIISASDDDFRRLSGLWSYAEQLSFVRPSLPESNRYHVTVVIEEFGERVNEEVGDVARDEAAQQNGHDFNAEYRIEEIYFDRRGHWRGDGDRIEEEGAQEGSIDPLLSNRERGHPRHILREYALGAKPFQSWREIRR